MKLFLTSDRKLIMIQNDDFMLKLNGKTNAEYKAILKPLGVDVTFESDPEKPEVLAAPVKLKGFDDD